MGGKQIIIKDYDKTLIKVTVSNEQAEKIISLLGLKDDTLINDAAANHNAIASYYGGTNPND